MNTSFHALNFSPSSDNIVLHSNFQFLQGCASLSFPVFSHLWHQSCDKIFMFHCQLFDNMEEALQPGLRTKQKKSDMEIYTAFPAITLLIPSQFAFYLLWMVKRFFLTLLAGEVALVRESNRALFSSSKWLCTKLWHAGWSEAHTSSSTR